MASVKDSDPDYPEFVEVDPTGRYGRYNDILGKGASKIVYRAFDEYDGIEVAWNQVKLYDFLQSPEDLERLYCEIHLLKTLKHKNIMKFYTSWVDTSKRNINFITEMFTSGTLRQYRQIHRRVNIRAVKHWCRQILNGLLYLHSHDPPIIHRDLKCDNIFVNGNQGQVKIGDLGLAAILRKSHAVHCVGTPEFMAPEVYEEEYNELVDIYSFGMCLLEMVTFEYPYSECIHPAQIYKKVISGTKPEALYRVKDPEVREFIEKCLTTASRRLSARELLKDPFLQTDDLGLSSFEEDDLSSMGHNLPQPYLIQAQSNGSLITDTLTDNQCNGMEFENGWVYDSTNIEAHGMDLFSSHDDEQPANIGISIKGRRREDSDIFLRLRIADRDGRVRNIYFAFDVEADTALSVATEMVAELDITEFDVTKIADMIDEEVALLMPDWKRGPGIEELPGVHTTTVCENCASNLSSCGSLLDYLSLMNPGGTDSQSYCCPHLEGAEMHGRFEEITYQVEETEHCVRDGAPMLSTSQSDELDYSSQASRGNHSDEHEQVEQSDEDEKATRKKGHMRSCSTISWSQLYVRSQQQKYLELSELRNHSPAANDSDNDIHRELRLLKAKCQMELQQYGSQQSQGSKRFVHDSPAFDNKKFGLHNGISGSSVMKSLQPFNGMMESFHLGKRNSFIIPESNADPTTNKKTPVDNDSMQFSCGCPDLEVQRDRNCEANAMGSSEMMFKAQNFYFHAVLPNSLPRTKSLPVDVGNI